MKTVWAICSYPLMCIKLTILANLLMNLAFQQLYRSEVDQKSFKATTAYSAFFFPVFGLSMIPASGGKVRLTE